MRLVHVYLFALFLWSLPVVAQEKPAATVSPFKVKGVTLPASITVTPTDARKKIVPVFDQPELVLDVKFKVISSGDSDPEFAVKGTGKDSYIEVGIPKKQDAFLVFCYVLYSGNPPWVSDAAQTIVEWGSGLPPPTTPTEPGTPPTTTPPTTTPPVTPPVTNIDQVFQSVRNVSAILILDMQTANAEVAAITQQNAAIKQHVEQPNTGNKWFQFDVRAQQLKQSNITTIRKNAQGQPIDGPLVDAQGKVKFPLPVVVLIDGSTQPAKMIGQPLPIQLTGNPVNTIQQMLTAIAGALKR